MFRFTFLLGVLMGVMAYSSEVISIIDVPKDKELCSSMQNQNWDAFKDKIVKIPKGSKFPVRLAIKGDFFSLPESEIVSLEVKKSFLMTIVEKQNTAVILLSMDGKQWKEPQEFFTGILSCGWGFDDEHLFVNAQGEFFERK